MTRLRLVKRMRVDDPETDMIVQLAKAGMSYKCIAQEAYGASTDYHVARVGYILAWEEVKVTDYRNGKNQMGRAMIAAIRREADVLDAIRTAAGQAAEATKVRKTG
jgi:hypothetical protein